MNAAKKPPSLNNLEVARMLEHRILPEVQHAHWLELQSWPHEGSLSNVEILKAGISFLLGENPHLSGFISGSTYRWQGPEFVIWMKEILESHVEGQRPYITAKEALECLTPFLAALLHHEDLSQEIH